MIVRVAIPVIVLLPVGKGNANVNLVKKYGTTYNISLWQVVFLSFV